MSSFLVPCQSRTAIRGTVDIRMIYEGADTELGRSRRWMSTTEDVQVVKFARRAGYTYQHPIPTSSIGPPTHSLAFLSSSPLIVFLRHQKQTS